MIVDPHTLIAYSILNAASDPSVATRGRYAFPRPSPSRADLRRAAKALRPTRLNATHAEGPRAERRAKASPTVRPPRLSAAEKALFARFRTRVALAACAVREAR